MYKISVVIICKNEAAIIGRTLKSVQGLTDDIVVYDNGSTDGTQSIARQFAVHLHEGSWEGFGKTKMKATALAKYDWILCLDADECIDEELKKELLVLQLNSPNELYDMRFKNFIGNTYLKYGEWGGDHHIRLFNRLAVRWDEEPVHEQLIYPADAVIRKINGFIEHYTMRNMDDYAAKMVKYAMLNGLKYHQQGKKAGWFKIRLSPGFTFLKYYIFKLGFLDGHYGYVCAKMTAWYTFLKYAKLKELNETGKA